MNAEDFRAMLETAFRNAAMGSPPPPGHVFCIACQQWGTELPLCEHLTAILAGNRLRQA